MGDECKVSGNTVEITLTEQETLSLNHNYRTKIQLRIRDTNGKLYRSNPIVTDTGELLEDEVFE